MISKLIDVNPNFFKLEHKVVLLLNDLLNTLLFFDIFYCVAARWCFNKFCPTSSLNFIVVKFLRCLVLQAEYLPVEHRIVLYFGFWFFLIPLRPWLWLLLNNTILSIIRVIPLHMAKIFKLRIYWIRIFIIIVCLSVAVAHTEIVKRSSSVVFRRPDLHDLWLSDDLSLDVVVTVWLYPNVNLQVVLANFILDLGLSKEQVFFHVLECLET